jgi:hypothetical protein
VSEELVLVTSFEELRAGMIVVMKCREPNPCLRRHRGMLLGGFIGPTIQCPEVDVSGYALDPSPNCWPTGTVVSTLTVHEHRVWRVIDGLERTTTETTKKRKPRVRSVLGEAREASVAGQGPNPLPVALPVRR